MNVEEAADEEEAADVEEADEEVEDTSDSEDDVAAELVLGCDSSGVCTTGCSMGLCSSILFSP